MKLLKFATYEQYVETQTETNKKKLPFVWVSNHELKTIAHYIREHVPGASFGLCHGVRNGYEVRRFESLLGCKVIGTEISETAAGVDNVIQWDFHDVKDEWVGNVDFIYSNSWDHSYDPDAMLSAWMKCIKPGGRCFLEWTQWHSDRGVGGADCFGASENEMRDWINGNFEVEAVLEISERIGGGLRVLNALRWVIFDKMRARNIRIFVVRHRTR